MAKFGKKCGDAKKAVNRDNMPIETGSLMHLEKQHKDWYNRSEMGKQRGKPKYAPPVIHFSRAKRKS